MCFWHADIQTWRIKTTAYKVQMTLLGGDLEREASGNGPTEVEVAPGAAAAPIQAATASEADPHGRAAAQLSMSDGERRLH